jgi:hypothetical protein
MIETVFYVVMVKSRRPIWELFAAAVSFGVLNMFLRAHGVTWSMAGLVTMALFVANSLFLASVVFGIGYAVRAFLAKRRNVLR